jgi:hypothetical protein
LHFSVTREVIGVLLSEANILAGTFAAFLFVFDVTSGFGTLEFTLGTRAGSGFSARPTARRLFT